MPCPDLVRVLVPELVPLLTGYTQAALAALVHLLDAWNVADDKNRPAAVTAIAAMLVTLKSPTSQPLAWFVVVARLGIHGAHKLAGDLECLSLASDGFTTINRPRRFWHQQFIQAAVNAPRQLGVWLCCGRVCVRVDGPSSHLGTDACDELARVEAFS